MFRYPVLCVSILLGLIPLGSLGQEVRVQDGISYTVKEVYSAEKAYDIQASPDLEVVLPQTGADFILPEPGGPFVATRNPTIWIPVFIDHLFEVHKDSVGKPLSLSIKYELLTISAVADVGFFRVPTERGAYFCFNYRPPATVWAYCRQYHPYPGGQCSQYFAVRWDNINYYISTVQKQNGLPMAKQTMMRVIGHAMVTLGQDWFLEQSVSAPMATDRNPHMSQLIKPVTYDHTGIIISGSDAVEMGRWRGWTRTINRACIDSGYVVQIFDIAA